MALALGEVPRALAGPGPALTEPLAAQPLAQALEALAQQTGLHFVYVSDVIRNQTSQPVPAGLSPDKALARLLDGTGLTFEFFTADSVRILPEGPHSSAARPTGDTPLPMVTITGSRILVPANISATSPLVVVTAQDITVTGHTDTGDVIRALPQMTVTGLDSSYYGVLGWGTATADLRGLGPQRTVVLINGRRLGLGDPNTGNFNPAPDLNQIPLPMIERVDVLTGGAAATYGSDAVAGVVNFILRDRLQGVEINAQYGFAQHDQHNYYFQAIEDASGVAHPTGATIDGAKRDLSILAGTAFSGGEGQVTGYFVYHGQDALYGSDRDFSSCPAINRNSTSGVPDGTGVECRGSLTSNLFVPDAGSGNWYSVVGNQFVPAPAADSVPPYRFNFARYESLQMQDTRYQAGLLAHLDLSRAVRPYFEFGFMDDRSVQQTAPSALFLGGNHLTADGNYLVNCSNPLLSPEEAAILCAPGEIAADRAQPGTVSANVAIGRRNIEGTPRETTFVHQNYRAVAGLRGQLSDAWSYNAYALYFRTSLTTEYQGMLSYAAADEALQVTTDQSGHPVCISGGSCVPYNIFTSGAVTAPQLAYLIKSATDRGANSEQIIEADVTGDLGRFGLVLPWAREGVALNTGAEYRAQSLSYAPSAAEAAHELAGIGAGTLPIDKQVSVREGFVEVRVPIAHQRPWITDLTAGGGYRYSVYSTAGAASTFKTDLQYAPTPDMRLRTSFDRVVRAPNLIELYTPLIYAPGYGGVWADPCAPDDHTGRARATLIECMRTGVTAAQYGNGIAPALGGTNTISQCGGCGAVTGGNPSLAPETADTWSLGMTFTPTAVPTFTASVDYFHITLQGAIGTIPGYVTLNQCLASGDPTWCSQIVRTSAGALFGKGVAGGGYIQQRYVNTGAARVAGIDVQANYRLLLPGRWGAVSASLNGSWLQQNSATPYRSAPSYDCAGLFGDTCRGSVNPNWRHTLLVTWQMKWNLQLSAQWRFLGRTSFDNNSPQAGLQNHEEDSFDPQLTHIPDYSYLDVGAQWWASPHLQFSGGVNNVLDKDPPLLPAGDLGYARSLNSLPAYDIVGRQVFLALRATL